MESIKNKVAIVEVGYTPQGKVPGRSAISLHLEATKNAIEDAGLKIEDIDGILTQREYTSGQLSAFFIPPIALTIVLPSALASSIPRLSCLTSPLLSA